MRRSLASMAIALVAGATLLAGCGTQFPLPTETSQGRLVPSDHSYQMVATWTGMDGIADILLTQGAGTQLFMLFQRPGAGTASRGAVYGFALKARPPVPAPLPGIEFRGLFNPHALCAGAGSVFVLDQGDTALARDQAAGLVSDLGLYWRVRQFGLLGGDTTSTFTDTTFATVQGIAADDQGRVYVAGSAIVLVPDPQDDHIRTRQFLYRIFRYLPVTPGSAPADPYMPGTDRWVRDVNYKVEEGSGVGTVTDPRGLYWVTGSATGGSALLAADYGKDWAQKLSDVMSSTAYFQIDAGRDTVLDRPEDVTADFNGFIYVADTGNGRVLRYDPFGAYVQKVNVELDSDQAPLVNPVAVAADDSLVYVADRAAGKVIRYERRK